MRRPDVFTLDYRHPLAQGLVFGLLNPKQGNTVTEDSLARRKGTLLVGTICVSDESIGRMCIVSTTEEEDRGVVFNSVPLGSIGDNGPFTMSAMRYAIPSNNFIIFSEARGAGYYRNALWFSENAIGYDNYPPSGGSVSASLSLQARKWAHVSIVCSGTALLYYIDGKYTGSLTRDVYDSAAYPLDSLRIGSTNQDAGIYKRFIGRIADPIIHNRALSQAEIAILADRTDPMLGGLIVEERPVLYFDMGGSTTHDLTASDLVTGAPALGTPALGQVHALTATGIATSAPVLGAPALGQVHELTATALTVSSPVLGTPAVGQIHSLTASTLVVGSPVLGTPLLTENAPDVDALTASDLIIGAPVLGTPSLGQIHVLGSDGLVTGAPVLGSPTLEINAEHLVAVDLIVGSPVLGAPAVGQVHLLSAVNLSVSAPVLDAPTLRQTHTLVADGLSVSSPVLGSPMLFGLEYVLQTRAELKSTGTTDFTASSFGTTHVELRCYGNYEVTEFGE